MSETSLPPDMEAALARLEKGIASRPATPVAAPVEDHSDEIAALKQKLAASEAQVARLRIALAGAASQRTAALAKVDSAVQQVEMLLTPAEAD